MTISHTAEKNCYHIAVTMKTAIFWDVTLQTDRKYFRQSYHLHHDGRSTMQMEAAVHSETTEFLLLMITFQCLGSNITSQECFDTLGHSQEKVQSTDNEA